MAELDYAFLAEFAQVVAGKLTAVGASFTALVTELPGQTMMCVAGRLRADVDEEPLQLTMSVAGPDDSYSIELTGLVGAHAGVRPYGDGKIGLLFAFGFFLPLPVAGLYTVDLSIEGELIRHLAFTAESPNAE